MDYNKDDFIAAVKSGQPYCIGWVEVRVDQPNRNLWCAGATRMIYLDGFALAFVYPHPDGPYWEIQWTLAGHRTYRAIEILNVLGGGLLGRQLVRHHCGKFYQVRVDRMFQREEEIAFWPLLLSSNWPGQEC